MFTGTKKDIVSKQNSPDKFWKRVDKKNGPILRIKLGRCWQWTGGVYNPDENGVGYGQAHYKGKPYGAHRLAWLFTFNDLPADLGVLHKCDNMLCVRPSHLFLGTPKQNTADMIAKGRRGSNLGKHVRTPEYRALMSKIMTGKPHKGTPHTEESKEKQRKAMTGRKLSPEHVANISKGLLGNTHAHDAWLRRQGK